MFDPICCKFPQEVRHDPDAGRFNVFNAPTLLKEIEGIRLEDDGSLNGPAFACVFPTGVCKAGCPHCFFASLPKVCRQYPEEEGLTAEGVRKTIRFLNDANVGYLLISGGGEPTENLPATLALVKHVRTARRIVLVTAGYFAANPLRGAALVDKLQQALESRCDDAELVLRLSLDAGHCRNLGQAPAVNLIRIFANVENPRFTLEIHTMIGDDTVDRVAAAMGARVEDVGANVNDGHTVMKNVPYRRCMHLDDGRRIPVGCAKLFYPDLVKDLNNRAACEAAVQVYLKDMAESELGNPSVAFSGEDHSVRGLDIWINQNGNVSCWGNDMPGYTSNIYCDSFADFRRRVMGVPGMRAYVERGDAYRSRIVGEVDPTAVFRVRAVNIRDYAGQLIFQEDRTRQYYTIRAVQDFIVDGLLDEDKLAGLSAAARAVLAMDAGQLMEQYRSCGNDMAYQALTQYGHDADAMADVLLLIRRGHFACDPGNVAMLFYRYCQLTRRHLTKIAELGADVDAGRQYARMKERMTQLPPRAVQYLRQAYCGIGKGERAS